MFSFEKLFKRPEELSIDRAVEKVVGNLTVEEAVNELERLNFGGGTYLNDQQLRAEAVNHLITVLADEKIILVPEELPAEATDPADQNYFVAMQFVEAYQEYQRAVGEAAV